MSRLKKSKLPKIFLGTLLSIALILPYLSAFLSNNFAEADTTINYRAKLNQNEAPITKWEQGDTVSRKVNVENTGIPGPDSGYGDVYVRVQLKENMLIGGAEIEKSTEKLMLGADGQFLSYGSKITAQNAYPGYTVVQYTALGETTAKWYVSIEGSEATGQHMPIKATMDRVDENIILKVGDQFIASGYTWLVLALDEAGNALVTTTEIVNATPGFSSSMGTYEGSGLDQNMLAFTNGTLKNSKNENIGLSADMRKVVQPVVIPSVVDEGLTYSNSYLSGVANPESKGLSYVDAEGEPKAFALSATEIRKYMGATYGGGWNLKTAARVAEGSTYNLVGTAGDWWLRSIGTSPTSGSRVETVGSVYGAGSATGHYCLRPALWLNPKSEIFKSVVGTPHKWSNPTPGTMAVGNYVELGLGTDGAGANIVDINSWDGTATNKWILDTNSSDGWAYWGQALAPGETTGNLLNKVTLIQKPSDAFYYTVTAKMEVVSGSNIGSLRDAPDKWKGVIPLSEAFKDVQIGDKPFASGYDWRVLEKDADGNLLIITDKIVTGTKVVDSGDYTSYAGSRLDENMKLFYNGTMGGNMGLSPAMQALVQKVYLPPEGATGVTDEKVGYSSNYLSEARGGLSRVDNSIGEAKCFALSATEVMEYMNGTYGSGANPNTPTTVNTGSTYGLVGGVGGSVGNWWLRSVGALSTNGSFVRTMGAVYGADSAAGSFGMRPALWIKP